MILQLIVLKLSMVLIQKLFSITASSKISCKKDFGLYYERNWKKNNVDTLHYDLYIRIKRFILKWKEFTSQIIILGLSPEVYRYWYPIKEIILKQYFKTCRLPHLTSLFIIFSYPAGRKILYIHHSFIALFKLHWRKIFRKIVQKGMIEFLVHSVIIFKNDLQQPPPTFKFHMELFISSNMTTIWYDWLLNCGYVNSRPLDKNIYVL